MKLPAIILIFIFCSKIFYGQNTHTEKPFVLGRIHEIHSTILAEKRILNIYLPEGYDAASHEKYPVIYLLDGGADEDFIHVTGLVQFNSFSWINRVPKSIVVGIANTDRKRDFTYPTTIEEDKKQYPTTGNSGQFITFIEKELQPFIESQYNTAPSKMLIGQSLGGLLAAEILLKNPALFDKYIIISPSLWWDNASLLNYPAEIYQKSFHHETDVYIGVGKEGLGPGKIPHVMEVDANLLADKIKASKSSSVQVHFDYLPQEDHATIAHQAIFNAFRLLYPVQAEKE